MKGTTTIYGVAMEILYIIATFAWKLCGANIDSFQAYRAIYSRELVAKSLTAIAAAKALKTSRQAIAARKSARVDLVSEATQVRQYWQDLKGYINAAYPKSKATIELESAGSLLFQKGPVNWSAVSELIAAANTYLSDNLETLKANNNMPDTFPRLFMLAGEAFVKQLDIFQLADLEKKNAVSNKLNANNAIYDSLIAMLKDGQLIFKNNENMRKQFTYEVLVAMNKGGFASLRGLITDTDGTPLAGVIIRSKDGKYTDTTNDKGRYDITRMEAGDYIFSIAKEGFLPTDKTANVKPGQANNFDIVLAKAMQLVA